MTGKRQQVRVVASSSASARDLYRLLVDGPSWPDWSPLDECVPEGIAPSEAESVGTLRRSRRGRVLGWDLITELVPDELFGYQHVKGLPVVDYFASVRLVENGEGSTTVTWEAAFTARYPGTGALIRRGVEKFLGDCARGLADYAPGTT